MPGTQQSPSCSREPWETAKDDDIAKLPPLPAPLLSLALSHPQRPLSQGKGARKVRAVSLDPWDGHACLGCDQRPTLVTRAQSQGNPELMNTGCLWLIPHEDTSALRKALAPVSARSALCWEPLEPLTSHPIFPENEPMTSKDFTAEGFVNENSNNLRGAASHDRRKPKFSGSVGAGTPPSASAVHWNSPVGLWPPGTLETQKMATDAHPS